MDFVYLPRYRHRLRRDRHGLKARDDGTTAGIRWMHNESVIYEFDRLTTEPERSQMTIYAGLERRSGKNRREHRLPLFKGLFFKGIRETMRRAEDRNQILVMDRYKPSLFIVIMIVLSLSLLDALLTLLLMAQGARELNPVMRYYLNHGPQVFLLVKYGLTTLSVLLIVLVQESLAPRYRFCTMILPVFAVVFGCVVIWEFYLLSI